MVGNGETQQSSKPSKFAGAMTKLNPFRTGHKYEKSLDMSDEEEKEEIDKPKEQKQNGVVGATGKTKPFWTSHHHHKEIEEKQEMAQTNDKQEEEKPKTVRNKVMQFEQRERSETIIMPNRTNRAKDEVNREKRQTAETPLVPPRPTQEEMDKANEASLNPEETMAKHGGLYPTLPNKSEDEALNADKANEDNGGEKKPVKVRRPKHHNPFMPRTGVKLAAVETAEEAQEEENVQTSTQEDENKDEEGTDKAEEKAKKPKRRNPFMPQVKNKVGQRRAAEETENEGENRCLFDQLEEFRFEPSQPESSEDADNLMEWWNTVENWEDTPQTEDMTPKEEAKAFAVTADKIQKGIRVFNKLFSERAESLWQHVIDLNGIADGLDKFNKKTKIAQITGGSTSATGGVLTIAGLALAPVTMGTSLIVTAVGLGVATAGGLTSAGAGISNQVNNSMDRKKVEKIVEDYQEKMVDLNKALMFIKQGIEHLRRFDLIKMKKQAYNRDFPVLNSRFYEDGAMAGKAILINANEIMRVVQIANVAGSTAARAVQIASMATGVLTGLFVGMDIYFVAKDSKELKKGAKSEFAAKIREVAQQLHDGLVELNTIREELQSTTAPKNEEEGGGGEGEEKGESEEKKKDEYDDEEEEDEIDRIKKQIKKDYENREWV
ncbi:apolipoprotein L1 [Boleophthalmus pectinirostris]|uniref:apolipoprotein L1 n=1 Tax=Boleophthalmus pectinirostris TaxID=150288 RepID=UPI002431F72F|nr:apolipoprotein L1 [Boleophthalmus pectinirostris]XP_055008081.1 apolipoprotein L1 [Boleophthalmus pectinirostris]